MGIMRMVLMTALLVASGVLVLALTLTLGARAGRGPALSGARPWRPPPDSSADRQ
jgi:hypothetical protein